MSKADLEKEKKEQESFLAACEYCENNQVNVRTQSIMRFLNGERIIRTKNDSPDIICKCQKGNKNYTVGIEVFLVDQNSKKHSDTMESRYCKDRSTVDKIFIKGNEEYLEGKDVTEQGKKLVKAAVPMIQNALNSSYNDLIETFRYHFSHHANRVSDYRKEIQKYSEGNEVQLAFFIEIRTYFNALFLNNGDTVTQYNSHLMPFFSDIINIINADKNRNQIDYIVFYLTSFQNTETQVVAIRTGNIKANLKNQGITIYEYAGENETRTLPKMNQYIEEENGDYTTRLSFADCDEEKMSKALQKAIKMKKEHIPFVTSRIIQSYLYSSKAKSYRELSDLQNDFLRKYPIKEHDNDQT